MSNVTSSLIKAAAPLAALLVLTLPVPANALSMKECSAKYQAAKKDGSLKGMKWNDFRKAQCGDDDVSMDEAAAAETAAPAPAPSSTMSKKSAGVSFPKAVSEKYGSESPGKARMHTCLDQYNAIKASNGGTAPMKWIEKGGGYYSECNKRLKGA
jgi:hypothetical protein